MFKKIKIPKNNKNTKKIKGYKKSNKKIYSKVLGFLSVLFLAFVGVGFYNQVGNIKFDLDSVLNMAGFDLKLEEIKANTSINKTIDGKTNILIIGRGGEENDAPNLTDSILIASINYEKEFISMLSVPRDLYVEFPTGGFGKINEAYHRGLLANKSDKIKGIKPLKEILAKITGEEIHYFIDLDFEGFEKIIDIVGGIFIDVPNAIVDHSYPDNNWGYQTFRISAGPQNLDGETALKYVRSRYSTSDFDRSIRQQLVIKGLREKVLSMGVLTIPSSIKNIYLTIVNHITTDLDLSQIINLSLFAKDIPKDNIVSSNINDTCFYGSDVCEKGGFLYVPLRADFNNLSVLLPYGASKNNVSNYNTLQKYTNLVLNYSEIYKENQIINVFNATRVGGLAGTTSDNLRKYGFNVPRYNSLGNVSETFEKSQIFYTGEKTKTIEALELFIFGGSTQVESLPMYGNNENVDIEIVIGDDYKFLNF